MAAADAPFRISIEAMSLGLTSAPRFCDTVPPTFEKSPLRFSPVTVVELSMGMPSTTIRGWPSPLMVLAPRIRMNEEAPGSPACDTTSTFGALPARASTKFISSLRWINPESTWFRTLPSFSACVTVPAPVTTISPSCSGFAMRVKSCVTVPGEIVICTDCTL